MKVITYTAIVEGDVDISSRDFDRELQVCGSEVITSTLMVDEFYPRDPK